MANNTTIQDVRGLLDRYLEVSNHYARELRNNLREYENTPSRLNTLINRLEAIRTLPTSSTPGAHAAVSDEPAQGQNIVRTADTLAALRISANEILERLEAPRDAVPRNLFWLRDWLRRDVSTIAAGFPSFTFAWDKLIDLNRLTLVPDSRLLRVRDNVILARMEFERFVLALSRLVGPPPKPRRTKAVSGDADPKLALRSLYTSQIADLDPSFEARARLVETLLQKRKNFLEQPFILQDTGGDSVTVTVDALALVGLEMGFVRWLSFASPSKEHRKTIIMSMLVCSKLLLVEALWQNAKEFSRFAINLTAKMNGELNLDPNEGIAMLKFNQLWARHKLGDNIVEDLEQWDVSGLHPRYSFIKSVLQRKFDDASRLLEMLLPKANSGEAGNFSMAEAEEWPILEDLRSSTQYQALKQKLNAAESRAIDKVS